MVANMDSQTEKLIRDVQTLSNAGFRHANKSRFEEITNPISEFAIVDDNKKNHFEPDITLVRHGHDSGGSGLRSGEFNALVSMHSESTGSASMSFALSKNTTPEQIAALDNLGTVVFPLTDGRSVVHMSMCPSGSKPEDSQVQNFEDCLMKLSELNLETVKYPTDDISLSLLPMFSAPENRPRDMTSDQIADFIVQNLGDQSLVFDDPTNAIQEALDQKNDIQQHQSYKMSNTPRPSMR
jgi:hypothetical protein